MKITEPLWVLAEGHIKLLRHSLTCCFSTFSSYHGKDGVLELCPRRTRVHWGVKEKRRVMSIEERKMRGKRVIELKDGSGKREVQREQQGGRVHLPITRGEGWRERWIRHVPGQSSPSSCPRGWVRRQTLFPCLRKGLRNQDVHQYCVSSGPCMASTTVVTSQSQIFKWLTVL